MLRPLAEAGHPVLIVMQPLGIAFTATDACEDEVSPTTGLLLHASYPASDPSSSLDAEVLSVSGTRDGLATRADVEASRPGLPAGTSFAAVEGAVHAFFGDHGPQPGDGTPAIGRTSARSEIAGASVAFVDAQDR